MRLPSTGSLDARLILAESRDAYAMLYQQDGGSAWLEPFHQLRRCTLHFASATGAEPTDGTFPRGIRPRRVLEPLVALLAMTGVITGGNAAECLMRAAGEPEISQIVFAWTEEGLLGPGLAPVESTFGLDELTQWNERLRLRVRMQDAANASRPKASMCYLGGRGWTAILRRSKG